MKVSLWARSSAQTVPTLMKAQLLTLLIQVHPHITYFRIHMCFCNVVCPKNTKFLHTLAVQKSPFRECCCQMKRTQVGEKEKTVHSNANLSNLMWDHLSVLHSLNYSVPRRVEEVVMRSPSSLQERTCIHCFSMPSCQYRLNITEGMSGMSHDRKRGAREPGYHVNVGFSNDGEICFANLPRRVEQGRVDIKLYTSST